MSGFSRSRSNLRWLVLLLSCLSMFSNYYCYDNPLALQTQLEEHWDPPLSDFKYNLWYSVYSFPNTVLPLIGGSMLDVFGTNGAMFTFLVLISLGQAIFALGVQRRVFWLSIVGRAVFGLGGESLSVAQSTLLAQWFEGKEMATAMGVNLSVSRLGSVANSLGNSHIARKVGVANALYIGFLMCCFSLVMTVLLILVDRYAAAQHRAAVASSGRIENLMDVASDEENLPPGVATPIIKPPEQSKENKEQVRLSDIQKFGLSFWLIALSCVLIYNAVFPFNDNAPKFLQKKYHFGTTASTNLVSITFTISALLSPFLGGAVDRFGHRATLVLVSSFALIIAHTTLLLSSAREAVPIALVVLGVGYSIYAAALWPAVAYVVPENMLGTAYGLVTSVQNSGLTLSGLVVGALTDNYGYTAMEIFFVGSCAAGIGVALWLLRVDARTGNMLNKVHLDTSKDEAKDGFRAPLLKGDEGSEAAH